MTTTPQTPSRPRHRWLRWLGAASVCVLALLAGSIYWLLCSASGLRFALARVEGLTHGALHIQQAQGRLIGPLEVAGLHYDDGRGTVVSITRAQLDLRPWPLLHKQLHVLSLDVDRVDVALPKPSPDDTSSSGFSLKPPVALMLDQVHVGPTTITQDGKMLFASTRLDLAGNWTDAGVAVSRLALDAPEGHVSLDGQIGIGKNYRGKGHAAATWKIGDNVYAGTLAVQSDGRLANIELTLAQPVVAQLHVDMDQRNDFAWTGKLDVPHFNPAPLIGDSALENLALNVHGSGDRRSGVLNGSIDLNNYHLLLQPLQARFDEDFKTLTLPQLSVASPQIKGTLNASGTIHLDARPVSGDLAIAWKDLELPANLVGQELDSHGNLTVRGSTNQYHAEGDVDIGPPRKLAKLALNLDGTPQQILLHTLKLQQPQGDLNASGTLSLQPQLAWQFQAVTHQFDPGQLLFGWQGSLNADFSTRGILASGGPDVTLELRKLDGQWLHRPLHGDGKLHLSPNRVVDGTLNLASGGSNVQIKAKPGDSNNADVTLAIASLSDFIPGMQGQLDGKFNVRGKLPKLAVDGTLQGQSIVWQSQKIGGLHLQASIPDISAPGGKLDLVATGVDADGLVFRDVHLNGYGNAAQHHLSLTLQGQPLSADLALTGSLKGSAWNGTLSTLTLDLQGLPRWRLQQPSRLSWNNGVANLSDLCLTAGEPLLCVSGLRDKAGNLNANYRLHAVPLALVMSAVATTDLPLRADGTLEGNGKLQRSAAGSLNGNASITSSRGSVTYLDQPDQPLLTYGNLSLTAELSPLSQRMTVHANLNGTGRLDGQLGINGAQQALDGQLNLHLDNLSFIELLTPSVAKVKGQLDGNFRLGGTLAQPAVTGQAGVENFSSEVPDLGLKLAQGRLIIGASGAQQLRITGSVQSGQGALAIDGIADLNKGAQSTITLKGQRFTAVDIPAAKVVASPDILIRRNAQGINATGSVLLDSADVNVDKMTGGDVGKASPDVVVVDRPQPAAGRSLLPITASVKVDLGSHTHLVGKGLDGHLTGVLTVDERPGRYTTGQGQVSVTGTYKAYAHDLNIEQGQLLFASTPIGNPGLNIRAERKLNPNATVDDGQRVGLQITGTAERPVLNVFSNPPMEQSDALAYLVTGKPLSQAKGGEGNMVGAAAQALGSAAGNRLAKSIGSKIGMDDVGVASSDALGGNSAFTVGKYLSPRLYLSYGVGLFQSGQVVTLRYRFTKRWNFEAENATDFSRASLNYRYEK
jgi:translocation and assembly module TamB